MNIHDFAWACCLYARLGTAAPHGLAGDARDGAPIWVATDGSTMGGPSGLGPSGWAYFASDLRWRAGGIDGVSSLFAELWAVVEVLADAPPSRPLVIVTDCEVVERLFERTPRGYRMYSGGALAIAAREDRDDWGGPVMRIRDLMWRRAGHVRVERVAGHAREFGDQRMRSADHLSRRARWLLMRNLGYDVTPVADALDLGPEVSQEASRRAG